MTYKEAKAYLQPIADNATLTGYREALCKAIEALEVADSVVRCKDCKHMSNDPEGYRWCAAWYRVQTMGDEGFCCFGERRSDESI